MTKEQKSEVIEALKGKFSQYTNFYVTDTEALTVAQVGKLRKACFDKNVEMKVAKNTLIRKALETLDGEKYAGMYDALHKVTALMFSENPKDPALIISSFRKDTKTEKPVLKAAFINGDVYMGNETLKSLTQIRTKNELIGEVIGLLQSPAKRVIAALLHHHEKQAQGTETAPEVKAEAAPEVKAEAKPVVEAAPEVKAETKPVVETAPEVKAETKPVVETTPEVKAETKPLVEATPEVKAETKPVVETAPGVKADAKPVVEAAPEVKAEAKQVVETAPEVKAETKPVAETAPEVKAEAKPVAETAPEVKAEAAPVVEAKPDAKAKTNDAETKPASE